MENEKYKRDKKHHSTTTHTNGSNTTKKFNIYKIIASIRNYNFSNDVPRNEDEEIPLQMS